MLAQNAAHEAPPGIAVAAQFFSWHSQYIWHAAELAPLAPALLAPAPPPLAPAELLPA